VSSNVGTFRDAGDLDGPLRLAVVNAPIANEGLSRYVLVNGPGGVSPTVQDVASTVAPSFLSFESLSA